jgi:hypothetical protein
LAKGCDDQVVEAVEESSWTGGGARLSSLRMRLAAQAMDEYRWISTFTNKLNLVSEFNLLLISTTQVKEV